MEKVRFRSPDGSVEKLMRPTHAIKVAAVMGPAFSDRVDPGVLHQACDAVRDSYRCRDVRKEIRQVTQMAIGAEAVGAPIEITCRDTGVLDQMRAAAQAA